MKIGFIGLGSMGAGMSRNLIKAGCPDVRQLSNSQSQCLTLFLSNLNLNFRDCSCFSVLPQIVSKIQDGTPSAITPSEQRLSLQR